MASVVQALRTHTAREVAEGLRTGEASDESLLARFAASDPDATSAFVARFGRRVFGLALSVIGDRHTAEDVAQEALLRAWRQAAAFDARRGSVATWLLTITRNLAIDAVRVRRPVAIDPDDLGDLSLSSSGRDTADVVAVRDDVRRLHEALTGLRADQRRAVVLAGLWGLTAREIAEREEIPLGTAKTRIRTALRRLRAALADPQRPNEAVTRSSGRLGFTNIRQGALS
jgi:RNA polymerase sigma factor (sigma-70 family)